MERADETPASPPATRAQEQQRLVKRGCQSVGGCLVLVLLVGVFSFAAESLLRRISVSTESDSVIVFANFKSVTNGMLFITFFAVMAMIFALSTRRVMTALLVVTSAYLVLGFCLWYWPYAAIAFADRQGSIELQYVWPRPNRTIDAKSIVAFDVIESSAPAVTAPIDLYQLVIKTKDGDSYRSLKTKSLAKIALARERIEQLGRE